MSDFTDLTQFHFEFLVREHCFRAATLNEQVVTYENGAIFFQIGMGWRGEVGLTFDRYPPSFFFPFALYLKGFYPDQFASLRERATASKLELDVAIGELARLLKSLGGPIIVGEAEVFDRVANAIKELWE